LGIRVFVEIFSLKEILHSNIFKAVIIEFYYVAEYYLPRIKSLKPSCPVIIDTVDVHYLRLHRKYEMTKDDNDLRIADEAKKRELAIYGQADITLTVTDEDARTLQKDNHDISTRILPSVHSLVPPTSGKNKNEIIFVGGFRHEPNIDAVVYFCDDIFPRIKKVIPEARFTVVGGNPPPQIRNLHNDFVTVTGYVPSTTPYLQKSYVSVAPLRYGAGMKGKIGEAMAHGLPVVTTSIGAEGMNLIDRKNILIADSNEKFAESVIELILDSGLYKIIQKNALEHIEKNFTPERISIQIEKILAELGEIQVRKMSFSTKTSIFVDYAYKYVKRKLNIIS
jgi:glycosyltransferase involved in cell wall biosynthesis